MATPPQRVSRQVRAARLSRRPPSFAVTLVALAIIFALAWMFFLRSGSAATAPVVNGIQGTYTWRPPAGGIDEDGTFAAVASGNAGGKAKLAPGETVFSYESPESAYDAASRTETTLGRAGRLPSVIRTTGEWPPAWRVATHSPLDYQGLAAVVRTAVEDGDDAVGIKPVKEEDRAVWRAAMTLDGKQIDVVVDQQTGIVTWYSDDAGTFTAKVDWGSPPPAGQTYTLDVPPGTEVEAIGGTEDYEESPESAGRTAGYAPLLSDLAPDGYALRAVATFAEGGTRPYVWAGHPSEAGPAQPPREPAVAQLYTRGLSWFTLEQLGPKVTRFYGSDLQDWPASSPDESLSLQQTTLQYGMLRGATAFTWYQASGPSLFVAGRRRAVFVTGALTRQELIAFAEGLKPVPADASR